MKIQLLNGPEGFTPDSEYLLGPTAVRGFWVACAFCAHGLAGAGGIGKVMAEWIVDGHPEWDMWRLDVRRFGPQYNFSLVLNDVFQAPEIHSLRL